MDELEFRAFRLDDALEQAGDEELLKELVGIALDEVPKNLAIALAARQEGDAPRLEFAAHTLRGSVTAFGARKLRRLLELVERAARDRVVDRCFEPLAKAEVEWKILAEEIEKWLSVVSRSESSPP